MLSDWKSRQLPHLLEKLSPDDSFNADETGPSLKGEMCSGGKRSNCSSVC